MEDNGKRPGSWLRHLVWLDELPDIRMAEEAPPGHGHEAPVIIEKLPIGEHRPHKHYVVGAVVVFVIIILGWIICSVFVSKTNIGTASKPSRISDKQLIATLGQQAAAYKLTIKYPDGQQNKYGLRDIGLSLDTGASLRATRQRQHELGTRLQWWKPAEADIVFKQDNTKFNNFVASQTNVIVQPSQDAALSIVNGEIRLSEAVVGKQYGLPKAQQTVLAASRGLRPRTVKLQTLTVNPALTAEILAPYKASLEKTINQPISFTINSRIIKPLPGDIANWLEITPDDKSKKVDITVNSGKVLAYINAAAKAFVYPPRAQIEVDQPDGSRQVLIAGVNGVDVTNKSTVASTVAKDLLSAKGITLPL
ncbi:MAG: hypothetical protein AAB971_01560, partial [Patescibacteria group bacterium]